MTARYGCIQIAARTFLVAVLVAITAHGQSSQLRSLTQLNLRHGADEADSLEESVKTKPLTFRDNNNVLPLAPARELRTPMRNPATTVPHGIEVSKIILPITEFKVLDLGVTFGTGFCLDPECRFIGTNYHVAMTQQPRRIGGEKVVQRYLATGPDDEDATVNDGAFVSGLKFALNRDLAIFELRRPLSRYHGVSFSLDDLRIGQHVDIYAFPKIEMNPARSLQSFRATFKGQTQTGLLAFDYDVSAGKTIRPGASGGIVLDSKTQQIVGILNGIARGDGTTALAVPVQSLADFVQKVQPCLAQKLFPSANRFVASSADLYPPFVTSHRDGLQHRSDEPAEVKVLREKAQAVADNMRNFIAVQTFSWGSGSKPPAEEAAYEIRMLDGFETFREYPNGKRTASDPPLPVFMKDAVSTGGEWTELPEMVGTELRLSIRQAAGALIEGLPLKVFQYRADSEDGVCRFRSIFDLMFFSLNRVATVACYGEVWTDQNTNILRISVHYELSGRWKDYQAVVTYGWLKRSTEEDKLIPVTISTQAEHGKKVYWCRGQFMNYRVFASKVRMAAN